MIWDVLEAAAVAAVSPAEAALAADAARADLVWEAVSEAADAVRAVPAWEAAAAAVDAAADQVSADHTRAVIPVDHITIPIITTGTALGDILMDMGIAVGTMAAGAVPGDYGRLL